MDFRFTNEYPLSRLDEIVAYLLGPRLWIPQTDYPDFEKWAEKTHKEIKGGTKRAIIALSQNQIVGAAIYQRHKQFTESLELKNLTVRPDQCGRYIASFLIRNTEVEGSREFGITSVLCDTKANNFGMRFFLLKHHYRVVVEADLYHLGAGNDVIYRKAIHSLHV